jgi:hypothetical protein
VVLVTHDRDLALRARRRIEIVDGVIARDELNRVGTPELRLGGPDAGGAGPSQGPARD